MRACFGSRSVCTHTQKRTPCRWRLVPLMLLSGAGSGTVLCLFPVRNDRASISCMLRRDAECEVRDRGDTDLCRFPSRGGSCCCCCNWRCTATCRCMETSFRTMCSHWPGSRHARHVWRRSFNTLLLTSMLLHFPSALPNKRITRR